MTTFREPVDLRHDGTVELLGELVPICNEMLTSGVPQRFAILAMAEALRYEGLRHLLQMWRDARAEDERGEIVADIAELLEDLTIEGVVELPAIRHREVAPLMAEVRAFKDALRQQVDRIGGISWLAEQTKIPQPSLSRFFNQASIPQRGTLLKLRAAMGQNAADLIDAWLRR
jgi:hypothetical protein